MTAVRVEAPARLHLGMLDPSGEGARRFGGLGVAVCRPAVVVEASVSDELTVEGPDRERALAVAERCRDALGGALAVLFSARRARRRNPARRAAERPRGRSRGSLP